MVRIRSIKETAQFFKEMDPDTQLTEKTIRRMIDNGVIPTLKSGNKYLINVDVLIEMFNIPVTGEIKISNTDSKFAVNK